ncbi:hypothetical protein BGX38DRAFT_1144760 [Terfezia claveryi]|nr:hypothetical protein BGX38DRAFT_1144760 [Terfezia claveryi]
MDTTASNAYSISHAVKSFKKVPFSISMEEYWTEILGLVCNDATENKHASGQTQVIRGLGWLAGGLTDLGHIKEGALPSFQTFANEGLLPLPISAATQTGTRQLRRGLGPGDKKTEVKKDTVASSAGKKGESKNPAASGKKGESKNPAASGKKGESKTQASSGDTGKGKRKKSVSLGDENKDKKERGKDRKGKGKAKDEESGSEGQVKKQGGTGKPKKTVGEGKKPAKAAGEREPSPPLPPRPLVGLEGTAIVIHGVPTYRRLSDLIIKLLLVPKGTEVMSLRWLLPGPQRAGKKASSLVLYLNTEEVPEDLVVRLGKNKMRISLYECDRGKQEDDEQEVEQEVEQDVDSRGQLLQRKLPYQSSPVGTTPPMETPESEDSCF